MIVSGFCPVQNKDVDIEVEYIPYNENGIAKGVKGVSRCEFAKSYGACTVTCPLRESAPAVI